MAALKYWLWLSALQGVSNLLKLSLLEHFQEPDAVYYGEREEYLLVEGMTRSAAQALEDKSLQEAEKILADCDRLDLQILTIRDAGYPYRLKNIYDPPILLYVQGRLPRFDEEVALAMVGTRRATDYACTMSEKLAFQMAGLGAVIVSGLAAGVDAAAHRGALRAGGTTVAVIGGGHDICFPQANRYLYEDIRCRGCILSEYPPGTSHLGQHFPVRNRIISGLCLGAVVVEAPERSGALISASRALDQGRDVFAVPGPIDDWHCAGSNKLLRDGAGVVTDAWDILSHYVSQYPHKIRALRVEEPGSYARTAQEREEGGPSHREVLPAPETEAAGPVLDLEGDCGLTDDQIRIVKELQGGELQVDDIIDRTQIPTRRVLSALTILEIDEIVTQSSGKRFSLAVTLK